MPDFVTSTAGPNNVFMQKMRDNILPFECTLNLKSSPLPQLTTSRRETQEF